jgi:glycosyltransferase involved in cell wall biosynthesis
MIVKNESKIITRLFDSVIDIIDSYVICDTGSTDNTVDIITAYFANKGIRGAIIYEPFRDFGYNRTHSLLACAQNTCEYVLLLDADMILEKGPQFNKAEFYKLLDKGGAHYLFQGSQHSSYKNVRIIANHRGITYWGVTHEYVCTPPSTVYNTINRDFLYINDIGDGGAKADKSERDIRLLLNGLKTNPDNDRYTFYLANSYRDNGQKEEAIETYRKRVKIGGWVEEIWQSYYQIGLCYKSMGKYEHAIYAWWEAYECMPDRLENIYEIISHYRHIGKHKLVCNIYHMIEGKLDKYRGKPLDFLFTEPCVYDYKIDYEYSISAYYAGEQDSRNIQRILC